jgi:hypothetical protein
MSPDDTIKDDVNFGHGLAQMENGSGVGVCLN